MKIHLLVSSLGPGGAERVATGLCNEWAAAGHEVTLVPTYSKYDGSSFYAISPKVRLASLSQSVSDGSISRLLPMALRRLLALRKTMQVDRPDVVISFLPNVNVAALIASAFMPMPCVIGERSDPSLMPTGATWRIACWLLYRFADTLTVQTEAVARKMPRIYSGIRRVDVVPNPLPAGLLDFECAYGREADRRILLSLGRLSEEKRVNQIINAFARLARKHPNWDLHIYGEGPLDRPLAEQIAALGLGERVLLKGPTRAPWQVMAQSDAFVMNSRFEGFPNALLEAMGVGLPCLAADCPSGPREISRDGQDACLFAPGDLDGLLAQLDALMSDAANRQRLGQQARASVSERYSRVSVMARWNALLASVMAKR